jgi:hypothetical protein
VHACVSSPFPTQNPQHSAFLLGVFFFAKGSDDDTPALHAILAENYRIIYVDSTGNP